MSAPVVEQQRRRGRPPSSANQAAAAAAASILVDVDSIPDGEAATDKKGNNFSIPHHRKTKSEEIRTFHCGCSKSYLSYPALYTHVKTKHGGIKPEGSFQMKSSNETKILGNSLKVGRPRLLNRIQGSSDNNKSNIQIKQQQKKQYESKQAKLDQQGIQYSKMVIASDLKFLDALEGEERGFCDDFQSCFPSFKSCNTLRIELHPLCTIMKKIEGKTFREDITSLSSIDNILSVFLFGSSRFMNTNVFSLVCLCFRAFRECLNDFGYSQINEFKKTIKEISAVTNKNTDHVSQNPAQGVGAVDSIDQQSESALNPNNNRSMPPLNSSNNQMSSNSSNGEENNLNNGSENSIPTNNNNQLFNRIINSNQSSNNQTGCYSASESAEHMLLLAEFFVLRYLPKYVPTFDQNLATLLIQDFANWLNRRHLSKIQLDLIPTFVEQQQQ